MRAFITGVTGQDGSYLAEQLASDGHEVFGLVRRHRPAPGRVRFLVGDMLDQPSLEAALHVARPDEVYNLAAVTAPGGGWGSPQPPLLADVTAVGVVRLLQAVARVCPAAAVVHASSSAVFDPHRYGLYGIAKRFAHDAVIGWRKELRCSNAVLYSHTSPRQDSRFLAPTIAATVARIRRGSPERLVLTDSKGARDWGYAPDYTRALQLIARARGAGDYTVATGKAHAVWEFVEAALDTVGLDWDAAVDVQQGPVAPDEAPAFIEPLQALGWQPSVRFEQMVRLMVEAA
jgi:GDPmannose 4,6-dehydratase